MKSEPLTIEEGKEIVGLARSTVDSFVESGKFTLRQWASDALSENRGVFVTLDSLVEEQRSLRGCVGFPYPVKPLGQAVQEAAAAASSEDPRFPPVVRDELERVVIEASVLTPPRALESAPRMLLPQSVRVGVDGLIVARGLASGLLLPQVAPEFGLNSAEFLAQACLKAGLPADAWLEPSTKVQAFQAEVFAEERPRGKVRRLTA